jgi:hypothetical protein
MEKKTNQQMQLGDQEQLGVFEEMAASSRERWQRKVTTAPKWSAPFPCRL